MTVEKVFDLQKELDHEKGYRVLLILPCQAYEVLETLWAGELFSLECIQIFFLSDSTKKKCFSEERAKVCCYFNVFPGNGRINIPM